MLPCHPVQCGFPDLQGGEFSMEKTCGTKLRCVSFLGAPWYPKTMQLYGCWCRVNYLWDGPFLIKVGSALVLVVWIGAVTWQKKGVRFTLFRLSKKLEVETVWIWMGKGYKSRGSQLSQRNHGCLANFVICETQKHPLILTSEFWGAAG